MIARAIERLWEVVARLDRLVVSLRIAGPAQADVSASIGEPVPGDVAEWFSWCNGVEHREGQVQDDAALIPGYEPLSITDAKAIKEWYEDYEGLLGRNWIPLLGTGGGDFYAAVYDEAALGARVVSVMIGGDSRLAFNSIEQMIDGFTELYAQGVFFVNEEGVLDADDERWIEFENRMVGS